MGPRSSVTPLRGQTNSCLYPSSLLENLSSAIATKYLKLGEVLQTVLCRLRGIGWMSLWTLGCLRGWQLLELDSVQESSPFKELGLSLEVSSVNDACSPGSDSKRICSLLLPKTEVVSAKLYLAFEASSSNKDT